MAITVFEAFPSRDQTLSENPSCDFIYNVIGTTDELIARYMVGIYAPITYDGLVRKSITLKQLAPDAFEGTVRFGGIKWPEIGDMKWAFDTTGGTQHITQSLSTANKYPRSGETAADYKGAIGVVDSNGSVNVDGCDIIIPKFTWTETWQMDPKLVPFNYAMTLRDLTGCTNDTAFRGFQPYEVVFTGARGSGSVKNPNVVELTYNFQADKNVTGKTIGDITGIAKNAWDYLWVQYVDEIDTTAKKLVKRPKAVYVERVYDSGDFSKLKIGT